MLACENGGPPSLPFSLGEEGTSSIPKMGGEERGPRPPSRSSAAHLRTEGKEECARTGDTNPGCNYLVRGYSPTMHYFWRGDMPHISPPLPFQRGRVGCHCVLSHGGPPNPAAGAVTRALHFGRDGAPGRRRVADPLAGKGRPGGAARVRSGPPS